MVRPKSGFLLGFVVILCSSGWLFNTSTHARQEGYSGPARYRIESVASGKALDLRREDGRTVQQYANSGATNQQWDIEDAGGGWVTLKAVENGKLLDFAENRSRDGVAVIVADRRSSDYQLWKLTDAGSGQFNIVSKTGRALDIPATQRLQDGAKLQVMGLHGLENQRFRLVRLGDLPPVTAGVRPRERTIDPRPTPTPVNNQARYGGPGRYTLQFVHSNKFLDLNLTDRETVQQWSGSGARNQQWEIEDAGGGFVYLRSGENGNALEVQSNRPTDGTPVVARPKANVDTQKWQIREVSNGEFSVISKLGRALDLHAFQNDDGVKLQLWKNNGAANQRFRFARVQGEAYVGGRVRGPQPTPTPTPTPIPETPYTPGTLRWRGRVDIEILLEVRGNTVTERPVAGRTFNNGKFSFSAPLPARALNLRVRNIKVRGSVEVVEQPSAANGWLAILRLRDPAGDAADYEFELSW